MHAGDHVKWVPLSAGGCIDRTGVNMRKAASGVLGKGPDGWGKRVSTFRLSANGSPYALCTMEDFHGETEYTWQPHVLAHVYHSPSPPPVPPATPPPWNIIRGTAIFLQTAVPDVPEEVR